MTTASLFGREREIQTLNDLVDRAHESGGTLVVRGEAGIGKSSLLAAAKIRARDREFQVLTTIGVQSEAHLAFAGLHQLLRPILAQVDRLPPPQRDAMHAAFGMTDVAVPDLFLIALATLHLLGDTAVSSPLLLIAEDVQWLDRPTSDVLVFVGRRLESDRIVLLAAIRDGFESPVIEAGLSEMRLERLDKAAAGALLDATAPHLATAVRDRVMVDAEGNPLALVELPASLRSAHLGGEELLPTWLPLTERLERAFAAQVTELPAATRTVLVIAAVDDGGGLAEILRAAAVIVGNEITVEALVPAVSLQLVEISGAEIRFRHPLIRSAIHQAASVSERHSAHGALAEVLADQPDRRAWHRAASIVGPDEDVASELEETAGRAERRGACAVAVAALERAAELSGDRGHRGRRLLRAADLAFELGRRDLVVQLLEQTETLELGASGRGRVRWLREMIAPRILRGAGDVRSLVEMADRARLEGDSDLALDLLWLVASRCLWTDPGEEVRASVVAAAERMGSIDDDLRLLAIIAYAAPIERGRIVIDRVSRAASGDHTDPEATRLLGTAANVVGAFDLAARFLGDAVRALRAQGRLGHLARLLVLQAWSATNLADWSVALPAAEEAGRLASETREPLWEAGAKIVQATQAAMRGDQDAAEAHAAKADLVGLPFGAGFMLAAAQMTRGAGAIAGGRHAEAYEHLRRLYDPADPAHHPFRCSRAVGDFAEAAVHIGRREEARAVVDELEPSARLTPSPWFHIGMRYARPLLAHDDDAEALFQVALDADLTRWPYDRARLLLAYGVWLRRQRRVAESRAPLRAARDAFDALGAIPWAEKARQELRASGETSRQRPLGAADLLTPQELQIAQMAAEGLSNREIGQQLYLSHRTVGSHLYRVFPKLGIASRSQLRSVLNRATASFS